MSVKKEYIAHLLIIGANLIYGINYSVSKGVMPHYIHPLGLAVLRVAGAVSVFWLISLGLKDTKVQPKHLAMMALCGIFGVALNQMMFLVGLNLTSPIDASIIMTLNPAAVIVMAAIIIGERIRALKITGIALGMSGAIMLIVNSGNGQLFSSLFTGNLLMLINTVSYALYLVLVKPLMRLYNPIVVMRWVFLFGSMIVIPFGFTDLWATDWHSIPTAGILGLLYIVIFTTIIAYFLNIAAMQRVSPTIVSTYIYTQPLIASTVALLFKQGQLTIVTIISAVLVFSGMYLVSKPATKKQ